MRPIFPVHPRDRLCAIAATALAVVKTYRQGGLRSPCLPNFSGSHDFFSSSRGNPTLNPTRENTRPFSVTATFLLLASLLVLLPLKNLNKVTLSSSSQVPNMLLKPMSHDQRFPPWLSAFVGGSGAALVTKLPEITQVAKQYATKIRDLMFARSTC